MVRQGGPSLVEQWWFFCWEQGGCSTRGFLGLRSFCQLLICLIVRSQM